jgi:hypothetical protein
LLNLSGQMYLISVVNWAWAGSHPHWAGKLTPRPEPCPPPDLKTCRDRGFCHFLHGSGKNNFLPFSQKLILEAGYHSAMASQAPRWVGPVLRNWMNNFQNRNSCFFPSIPHIISLTYCSSPRLTAPSKSTCHSSPKLWHHP